MVILQELPSPTTLPSFKKLNKNGYRKRTIL